MKEEEEGTKILVQSIFSNIYMGRQRGQKILHRLVLRLHKTLHPNRAQSVSRLATAAIQPAFLQAPH